MRNLTVGDRLNSSIRLTDRIDELRFRIGQLYREIDRLLAARNRGQGGHDWDEKMQKCWLCGMHMLLFDLDYVACKGDVNLQEPFNFEI